jgi:hypothetical protein
METRTNDRQSSLWNKKECLQGLSGAVIVDQYRYCLWRQWHAQRPRVTFVMLNPSTADASHNDPTIRRCLAFARAWGGGSLEVVNLFAYQATQPKMLLTVANPVGQENDAYILQAAARSSALIAAWGCYGHYRGRDRAVVELLTMHGYTLSCLGCTQDGFPRHPLYLRKETSQYAFPCLSR